MQGDQFTKLFNYMTERFDALEAKIDTKADGERVYAALDRLTGDVDHIKIEFTARDHQVNQHEEWIERASSQLKVKYDRGA